MHFIRALSAITIALAQTVGYVLWSLVQPGRIDELKQMWGHSVLKTFGFEVVINGEAPPEKNVPMVLVGNHFSFLDIPLVTAATQGIVFIAKKEIRSWPIFGWAGVRVKTIFVERENKENRARVRQHIILQLQQDAAKVVVFPSGTTTLDENILWKKGIFEIAQQARLPVKPFHLRFEPWRECAYVDDDTILSQLIKIMSYPKRRAVLTWLDTFYVENPPEDAENIRLKVVAIDKTYAHSPNAL